MVNQIQMFFAKLSAKKSIEKNLTRNNLVGAYKVSQTEAGQAVLHSIEPNHSGNDTNIGTLLAMDKITKELQSDEVKIGDGTVSNLSYIGVNYPDAFDTLTTLKPDDPRVIESQIAVSKAIRQKGYPASDNQAGVNHYSRGGAIGMKAIRTYSRLGMLEECQEALRWHDRNYFDGNGNPSRAKKIIEEFKGAEDEVILVQAAVNISPDSTDLSIEMADLLLQKSTDEQSADNIISKLHRKIRHDDNGIDPAIQVLLRYAHDPKDNANNGLKKSKKSAFETLSSREIFCTMNDETKTAYYKTAMAGIKQGNENILSHFKNGDDVQFFLIHHDQHQRQTQKERIPTKLDKVLNHTTSGLHARVYLANLFFDPIDEGKQTDPHQARKLITPVITSDLPDDHPDVKQAAFLMSELVFHEAREQLKIQEKLSEKGQGVVKQEDLDRTGLARITLNDIFGDPLSKVGGLRAEAILNRAKGQWDAVSNKPLPDPVHTVQKLDK